MATVTLSPKFQVVIPKEVRKNLNLKQGQRMSVIVKGGLVYLIPERPVETFRGFLKGMEGENMREDEDRV